MKYFLPLFLLISGLGFSLEPFCQEEILNYSQNHLSHSGVLKKKSNGFVYVDVEDSYIHELVRWIESEGFQEPPYFAFPYSAGAHISVIYSDEADEIGEIAECGQTIGFSIKDCEVVTPPNWQEVEAVYILTVDAPELDALRAKYGLPEKRFAFHITIGVKPRQAS